MSSSAEAVVTDYTLAQSVGEEIIVGGAFAFLSAKALASPPLSWVSTLLGRELGRGPIIIPLDARGTAIPGAVVTPKLPTRLPLRAIASDKRLYQEKKDVVHLCVVEPSAADMELTIEVRQNDVVFAKHRVALDGRGCGQVTLRDLPTGDFTAQFRGQTEHVCSFTVAEYRLAPLVARILERNATTHMLEAVLGLTTFGEPVEGEIDIDVLDGGRRASRTRVHAHDGRAEAKVKLLGAGPHELAIQLVQDPSRTATVPIIGSRAEERSDTTFCQLGTVVTGSMLPREGSRDVRGIFLSEGAIATTPLRLSEVVTRTARFSAATTIERACFVVVDPAFPERRKNAVDQKTAHPALEDKDYVRAEELFKQHRYPEAGDLFLEARTRSKTAHPNYAYYIACCDAVMGNREAARRWLYEAIRDGWSDFDHMATDADLANLRGWEPYETLARGGRKVIHKGRIEAGEAIEIDIGDPLAIVLVGAIIDGLPWEGWATVIAPSKIGVVVDAPETTKPGSRVRIGISTDQATSVYAILKDARLLSADTPASRLAAATKAYVERASKSLGVFKPTKTLASFSPPTPMPAYMGGIDYEHMPRQGGFGPPPMPPPMARSMSYAASMPAAAPQAMPLGGMYDLEARGGSFGAPPAMALRAPAPAPGAPPPPMGAPPPIAGRGAAEGAPYREPATRAPALPEEEPEVLFAGLVALDNGEGAIDVQLPDAVADYIVELFALSGLDWTSSETRFRAEKPTFVTLQVPPFVHPADVALGQLHVGSASGNARVRLFRDGAEVPLVHDGAPLANGSLRERRAALSFLAGPGDYEAVVEDPNGSVDRTRAHINVPGKLRRQVKTLKLLEAGDELSRKSDPSIVALRALPGLEKPFTALVDATADYGHACCEQTAAKMLSACAMYLFAEAASSRRSKAESIILAGVRRERTMWLERRGFKMYPESSSPDSYWGPKAARYLFQLGLLRSNGISSNLSDGIGEGITMAEDAARAYGLEWPPKRPSTCEDAYAMARFGNAAGDALGFVSERQKHLLSASSFPGGAVGLRVELAYAAATLFRAGKDPQRKTAIEMTNRVASAFDGGRLYSTVDSVAAIALMSELTASGIVGGEGRVEIDGKPMTSKQAVAHVPEIDRIVVTHGLCPVEVTKWVEEDWSTLRGDVTMHLSLEKKGTPVRAFAPLDAVDLRIKLVDGYRPGDLAWICLPAALSRVIGGGQVKRFSVDFAGKDEIVVPLAATGVTVGRSAQPAPQHFAACVRNMFEEERGASAGLVEVSVADAPGGVLSRALTSLKGLFG